MQSLDEIQKIDKQLSETKRTLSLNGFGISIKVCGKQLIITNGVDRLYPNNQFQIVLSDHADFDKIVISGTGAISFSALQWLTEWGINVIMLDNRGRLYGTFNQIAGNTEYLLKKKQYAFFDNPSKRLALQKWIVSHKVTSQIMLNRELQLDTEYLENEFAKLRTASKRKDMESIESHISKRHYYNIAKMLPKELGFETRANKLTRRTNDATDVINALLNYGFGILQAETAKQLNAIGFDCYVGFMHNDHAGHAPLIWDMMELGRPLVDKSVISIAESITKDDYYFRMGNLEYPYKHASPFFNRWLIMTKDLKKRYIASLSTVLQSKRYLKATIGKRTESGFQKKTESTILKDMCIELRDFILERKKTLSEPPRILVR